MTWQADLAESYTKPEELLNFLGLDVSRCGRNLQPEFPFRVTRSYARRMVHGDPMDPLLMQVLPLDDELAAVNPLFRQGSRDPVGDLLARRAPGLLHKYHGRVLLITTGACAIHCRYCFRRNFPYAESQLTRSAEAGLHDFLQKNPEIDEIILSGGDPLVLSDQRLEALMVNLNACRQIRRLRIHSRLPLVLPSRITSELLALLRSQPFPVTLVLHANHAAEFDQETLTALAQLSHAGVRLLNQSVLLKGVNDSVNALRSLSETLFDKAGVMPYYLHLLDRAEGVLHFEVDEARALSLYDQLRRVLPGYLVPRLVREIEGQPYKTLSL